MVDYDLESAAGGPVAGIDEAGRGPLAGPVVAAAVILDPAAVASGLFAGIDDSKKLGAEARRRFATLLSQHARFGIGAASAGEIDRINILAASLLAMQRALARLGIVPRLALIDGNRAPVLPCAVQTVIGGDGKSLSIAAASILAKVTRDRAMTRLAARYPLFGWERNAGYPTADHLAALRSHGVSKHHRLSFAPVRRALEFVGPNEVAH